jgi:hypothetical protein
MKNLRANSVAFAIVLVSVAAYLPYAPARMYDFRAFYCAGKSISERADPYRLHPLQECERRTTAPGMPVDGDDVTVPAPLPGYLLAIFALLSTLPFGLCALLWIAASIAATVGSIALLRRVLGLPVATITVAIFLPAAIVAIPLGQLAPFVGCAIAMCAYGLASARWRLAAAGALATSADPAVAVVLCATLLVAVPATRAPILWGTAALATIALLTLGTDTNLEYVRTVLHAHAAGNVAERSQFSAAHFAWVVGLGSRTALVLGTVWYGCSAVVGVWVAARLRRKFGLAALAFVPPAFAVFGGLYVHFSQAVLAIPAYLMALREVPIRFVWLPAAIFVLAVPWLALAGFPPFGIALVALAIAYSRDIEDERRGLRLGLASAALLVVFFALGSTMIDVHASSFHLEAAQSSLAETAWSRYVEWRDPKPSRLFLMLELPTIVAFTACLAGLVFMSISEARSSSVRIRSASNVARRLNPGAESPMDSV